jgi:hypothetical protein
VADLADSDHAACKQSILDGRQPFPDR